MEDFDKHEEKQKVDKNEPSESVESDAADTSASAGEDASADEAAQAAETPATDAKGSGESMENLMDMYEESFKRFAEGEVVSGRIISVDKDHVLVDIGYKSEGQIRINEFKDENGNITAQVGDKIEVMVEWWDDEEERVILSKEKAENVKIWEEIKKSYDEEGIIEGIITNRVKWSISLA